MVAPAATGRPTAALHAAAIAQGVWQTSPQSVKSATCERYSFSNATKTKF